MGISFGVIVMPLVTQFLLDLYGWRVTILLISALNFHLVVSGALLRPITPLNEEQDDTKNCGDSQSTMPSADNQKGTIQKIVYYFDLDLFNNINFISYMVYSTFTGYCFTGWLIYLVPHALEIGFSSTASSALATCGGIGNLVANILYPIIRLKFSNKQVVYSTAFVSFLAMTFDPLFTASASYMGLLFSAATFGFTRALGSTCMVSLIKDLVVDEDKITNGVIWLNVTYSIGSVISGFLSGKCYQGSL